MRQKLVWAAMFAVVGGGCWTPVTNKACTEIGCGDQLTVTVTGETGTFPEGLHRLEMTVGGAVTTCTFTIAGAGSGATARCAPGTAVTLTVGPATSCTETKTPTATSLTCTPIPGMFREIVTMMGRPAAVRFRQTVNDAVLFDRTEMPSYVETRPNGAGCEPVCRQAELSWSFTENPPPTN